VLPAVNHKPVNAAAVKLLRSGQGMDCFRTRRNTSTEHAARDASVNYRTALDDRNLQA
jgi:hypothetical protein